MKMILTFPKVEYNTILTIKKSDVDKYLPLIQKYKVEDGKSVVEYLKDCGLKFKYKKVRAIIISDEIKEWR